uniref:Uncharacterized protein n=1 Tax=Cucumis melo TaxID=3656 RepID=A0A9I9EFA5_CUCME
MVAPSPFVAAHFRATVAFPTQTRHLKPTDSTKQYGRGGDDGLCSSVNPSVAAFCFVFLNLSSLPLCPVLSSAILLHFGPLSAYERQDNNAARSRAVCFDFNGQECILDLKDAYIFCEFLYNCVQVTPEFGSEYQSYFAEIFTITTTFISHARRC